MPQAIAKCAGGMNATAPHQLSTWHYAKYAKKSTQYMSQENLYNIIGRDDGEDSTPG